MNHIKLENEEETVRKFFSHLPDDPEGTILELGGEPVARVIPVVTEKVDRAMLKAAILNRRDASRASNGDWGTSDLETWDQIPD
jgi:hypothetical protein